MGNQQVTTSTGTMILEDTTITAFHESLRGELLRPGYTGYDDVRKVWNGMIDRKPALIVRCAGVADVMNAVHFARTHHLLVAVRGGGHNVAGNAVCDGGLMIDLSPMKGIRVDPVKRTARAEAGVTWGEFDHETQTHGLATTGGLISTTGIAGLTLGGGLGWLMRKYGLACDNLLSVDIVTADGRLLTASATENADLFWGIRGGGGNFGIVTSFEYRLYPVGPLLAGMVIYPIEKAKEVLKFYRDYNREAPDELATLPVLITSPEGVPVVVIAVCYLGSIEAGEPFVQPLRTFDSPLVDQVGPMAYTAVQKMFDAGFPAGLQNYWKSSFLRELGDEAIDTIVDHFAQVTSPLSGVAIECFGGAVSRVGVEETAFNHRDALYNLLVLSIWSDPGEHAKHIQWARTLWEEMQPFSSGGVYVNYLGQESDEGIERVKAAYGAAKYERLMALKQRYDPTNLFRLNQNIKPMG